jgi:pyruvate dehydrogenase E2 component (dihydrolipoamide acetyltransferase)
LKRNCSPGNAFKTDDDPITQGATMLVEVKIPDISENVTSGTVVGVHVRVGEAVKVDDVLIELETDKAVVEIPSPAAGVVTEILVKEGEERKVGEVIARIDTEAEASDTAAPDEDGPAAARADTAAPLAEGDPEAAVVAGDLPPETASPGRADLASEAAAPAFAAETGPGRALVQEAPKVAAAGPAPPAAPSVRRLARELGVDLHRVAASGPGGHLTAADVRAFAKTGLKGRPPAPAATPGMPDFTAWGEVEVVDLAGIRKATAANMAAAWQTVPHVTQFDEADVTELEVFLRQKAAQVEKAGGKLTLTAVLVKVIAAALRRYPYFNASIDTEAGRVILKKYVHIGVAVATDYGLMVPVVRTADRKNLTQIAVEIVDLAKKARSRKIHPREMEGATFTISNQGGIGGLAFTPIVAWPQVGILGISRTSLRQRPVGENHRFAPRRVLPLCLSYDHRLIDGADAAAFLHWVCETLEAPLNLVLESD